MYWTSKWNPDLDLHQGSLIVWWIKHFVVTFRSNILILTLSKCANFCLILCVSSKFQLQIQFFCLHSPIVKTFVYFKILYKDKVSECNYVYSLELYVKRSWAWSKSEKKSKIWVKNFISKFIFKTWIKKLKFESQVQSSSLKLKFNIQI